MVMDLPEELKDKEGEHVAEKLKLHWAALLQMIQISSVKKTTTTAYVHRDPPSQHIPEVMDPHPED